MQANYLKPRAEVFPIGAEGSFLGASNTMEDYNVVPIEWGRGANDEFGF